MQKAKIPSPLVRDIAARIEADWVSIAPNGILPGLRDLAQLFDVSRPTITRAVHLLREKGVLTGSACRRARGAGRPGTLHNSGSDARKLRSWLIEAIETGSYATGDALPKMMYFAAEKNISARGVQRVYAELAQEGFVHKSRRRYYVGAPQLDVGNSKRFIAILCAKTTSWTVLCGNWRIGSVGRAFAAEASRNSISLLQIVASPVPPKSSVFSGFEGASRCISRYGDRLIGTLIIDKREVLPEIDAWVRFLGKHAPCAVFDPTDTEDWVPIRARTLTRAYIPEKAMVETAIGYLYRHGHRRIAFPSYPSVDWQSVRADIMEDVCRSRYPEIDLVRTSLFAHNDWRLPAKVPRLSATLEFCGTTGHALVKDAMAFLSHRGTESIPHQSWGIADHWTGSPYWAIALTMVYMCYNMEPVLPPEVLRRARIIPAAMVFSEIIQAGGCTAIIAPNDVTAISLFLNNATLLGIRIPDAISLLGFDNKYPYGFIPLTTVDNGSQGLGYKAFHMLLGDIRIHTHKHGAVASEPFIIDRGSIVAPGAPLTWNSINT